MLAAGEARAGGGAHVVDDATVETPGVCHLESWVTRYGEGRGLVNSSPACTRKAWPNLEIGAGFQHAWDGVTYTTFGPALKLNLRSVERGWGIGVATAGAWSLDHAHLETASVVVPVTVPAGKRLRLNFNAGWLYSLHGPDRNAAFAGAQAEIQLGRDLGAMGEVFGRDHGPVGGQVGLRWNPRGGDVDLDLLAGRYIDGASRNAITFGLTIRH